eukprot:m.207716 g.207716  ORF g.207716 m.207716 type:complete len:2204 (-) comp32991_c0_seq1:55-6666(-)
MSLRKRKPRKIYSKVKEDETLIESSDDEEDLEKSLALAEVKGVTVVVDGANIGGVFDKVLKKKSTYPVTLKLDYIPDSISEEPEEELLRRCMSSGSETAPDEPLVPRCLSVPSMPSLQGLDANSDSDGKPDDDKSYEGRVDSSPQNHTFQASMTLATACDSRRVRNLEAPEETKYFAFCYGCVDAPPADAPLHIQQFCKHGGFVYFDEDQEFMAVYQIQVCNKNTPRTEVTFDLLKCLDLPLDEHHRLFELDEAHPLYVSNCNKYHFQMQLLGRRVGIVYYQHQDQDDPCVYEIVTRSRRADTQSSFSSQFHRPLSHLEGSNADNPDEDDTWQGGNDEFSRLCDEFVNNFKFEGIDATHVEFKQARNKNPIIMENCELRLQGKRVQLRNDTMTMYFDLRRPVRRNECGEFPNTEGSKRGRGYFDLHGAGANFMLSYGSKGSFTKIDPPSRVRVNCSETDFMDWRRVFSINLGVFLENKDSIFEPRANKILMMDHAKSEQLGQGASGSVRKIFIDGIPYAVKQVTPKIYPDLVQLYLEAQIMISLRDPRIAPFKFISFEKQIEPSSPSSPGSNIAINIEDADESAVAATDENGDCFNTTFFLVMGFAAGGSLERYLYSETGLGSKHDPYASTPKTRLPNNVLLRIWKEIFGAIKYLHEHGLIHRDIKPENIVVDANLEKLDSTELKIRQYRGNPLVKIVDFGQSFQYTDMGNSDLTIDYDSDSGPQKADISNILKSTRRGTPNYIAPEMRVQARKTKYTPKVDVFSSMLVVWECWIRRRAYSEMTGFRLDDYVKRGNIPELSGFPPFLEAVVRFGLLANPDLRPDASKVFDIFLNNESAMAGDEEQEEEVNIAAVPFLFVDAFSTFYEKLLARYAQRFPTTEIGMPQRSMEIACREQLDLVETQLGWAPAIAKTPLKAKEAELMAELQQLKRVRKSTLTIGLHGHVLRGLVHLVAFCPCYLLPVGCYNSLLSEMHALVCDSNAFDPFDVDVDWSKYGSILIGKLQMALGVAKKSSQCDVEAVVTILALCSAVGDKKSRIDMLNLVKRDLEDCPREQQDSRKLIPCLIKMLTTDGVRERYSSWALAMCFRILADLIALSDVQSFIDKEVTLDLLRVMNTSCASLLEGSDADFIVATPCKTAAYRSFPKIPRALGLLTQIARLATQLSSLGNVNSSLPLRMFVSNCEIIPTLILVQSKLDLNNLTGEVSEFIFHLARLLCVTQSQTSAALDILEKWLLDLPWDDKPRRENTEPVRVLNQKYVVSKRFHGAIIDALLVQISSQLKQNAALLSIILYVVYKNRRTGAGSKTIPLELNRAYGDIETPDLGLAVLSPFANAVTGFRVVCQLLEECFEGSAVPKHLRLKVLWICIHVAHNCIMSQAHTWQSRRAVVEKRERIGRGYVDIMPSFPSARKAWQTEAGEIPKLLADLIPILIDISNDKRSGLGFALAPYPTSASYARDVAANMITPPALYLLNELQAVELSHYFEQVLSSFMTGYDTETMEEGTELPNVELCDLALKGLWHLTSDSCHAAENVRIELSRSASFLQCAHFALEAESASELKFRNYKFVRSMARFTPHIGALMYHETVLDAVLSIENADLAHNLAAVIKLPTASSNVMLPMIRPISSIFDNIPRPDVVHCCRIIDMCVSVCEQHQPLAKPITAALIGVTFPDNADFAPWESWESHACEDPDPDMFVIRSFANLKDIMMAKEPFETGDAVAFTGTLLNLWTWMLPKSYKSGKVIECLDQLTAWTIVQIFRDPPTTIHWNEPDHVQAVMNTVNLFQTCYQERFVSEIDSIFLMGMWVSEFFLSETLCRNAIMALDKITEMIVPEASVKSWSNPGFSIKNKPNSFQRSEIVDVAPDQLRRKAYERLPAQFPERLLDLATDNFGDNVSMMECVRRIRHRLYLYPLSARPTKELPKQIQTENDERQARVCLQLTQSLLKECIFKLSELSAYVYGDALVKHSQLEKPSLSVLTIEGLNQKTFAQSLVRGLKTCTTLTEVQFYGAAVGLQLAAVLCDLLFRDIKVILLNCSLGQSGAKGLVTFLVEHPTKIALCKDNRTKWSMSSHSALTSLIWPEDQTGEKPGLIERVGTRMRDTVSRVVRPSYAVDAAFKASTVRHGTTLTNDVSASSLTSTTSNTTPPLSPSPTSSSPTMPKSILKASSLKSMKSMKSNRRSDITVVSSYSTDSNMTTDSFAIDEEEEDA